MEHYHHAGHRLELLGNVGEHPEIARIGAESGDFGERAVGRLPGAPPSQAIDSIHLGQVSQEFDIFSEGHGGS
jgi:hypothetical protein